MVVPLAMSLSKQNKFSIIAINNDKDEDETPPPFIAIQLGIDRLETHAFIDSKVDCNTISYELFQKLKGVHLKDINVVF